MDFVEKNPLVKLQPHCPNISEEPQQPIGSSFLPYLSVLCILFHNELIHLSLIFLFPFLCQPETFGLQSGRGCVPCNCNSFGSKSFDCEESGQCWCQPGVTGKKCDRCARGYFNFQEGGCTGL